MMTDDIPKLHLLTLERVLGVDSPVVPNNEPVSSIWYNFPCAPIEDSDQSAHPRSLIRVFDGRSMGSQGSDVSSGGTLRLLSDCVDVQIHSKLIKNFK